jgi:diguanylate cyclase (GGDEF)-like protein/PAS domain S-box-containing protein
VQKEFYRNLLDNLFEGVYFVDAQHRIVFWNKAAEEITGFSAQELLGKPMWEHLFLYIGSRGPEPMGLCLLQQSLREGRLLQEDLYIQHKAGYRVPVSLRVGPLRDSRGLKGAVGIFKDNSRELAHMQKLRELQERGFFDPLTQMANRQYMELNLQSRLYEKKRYGWPFGVLHVKVQRFGRIQEVFGQKVADEVVKLVARTLLFHLRPFDVAGRWAQDELVAIVVNVNEAKLKSIAQRVATLLKEPAHTGADILKVEVSVGATLALANDTVSSLVNRASKLSP